MTIQDIANVLVEKNNLSQAEAEAFVTAIFEIVEAGIETDKLVKIKGLGTFKVVNVDARESVNVNTGERVIIDSHDKITFTPDSMMKELVNKPFSSFETVVLNEGIEFEDTPVQEDGEQIEENVTADEAKADVIEPEKVVEKTIQSEDGAEPEVASIVSDTVEEDIPSQSENESIPAEEETTTVLFDENIEDTQKEAMTSNTPCWKWIAMALVCISIGFATGFYTHQYMTAEPSDTKQSEVVTTDTIAKPSNTIAKATVSQEKETASVAKDTLQKLDSTIAPIPEPVQEAQPKNEDVDYLKYEEMDIRVKTGAYYIIGTQSVEKAREGDDVNKISRRYLGDGMSCYVEVYNGMKASTQLQAGQEIKIPKLIMKKTFKMRMKQQKKENQQ